MAYIQERAYPDGTITYRVRVRVKGMPDKSATFSKKAQAKAWGQKMEAEVRNGRYFSRQEDKERTFAEFIDRYIETSYRGSPKALKSKDATPLVEKAPGLLLFMSCDTSHGC